MKGASSFQDSAYCCISNCIGWSFHSSMYIYTVCFLFSWYQWLNTEQLNQWDDLQTCLELVVCCYSCAGAQYGLSGLWLHLWYFFVGFVCSIVHCFSEVFHHGTHLDLKHISNTHNPFWSYASISWLDMRHEEQYLQKQVDQKDYSLKIENVLILTYITLWKQVWVLILFMNVLQDMSQQNSRWHVTYLFYIFSESGIFAFLLQIT
jgi:hypothetical protein